MGVSRYVLLPLRPAPLVRVGAFTLGLGLAWHAPLVGIPLAIIIVSWFFKYCFVLFDATVAGDEPPVLSVEMVNPLDEQRPLVQALVIVAAYKVLGVLRTTLGEPALIVGAALLLAVLPANIALLGISRNAFHAVSPLALVALVRGLGRDYMHVLLAAALCVVIAYGSWLFAPPGITIALIQFAFLIAFAVLGGAVHENRFALGIPSRTREERISERKQREHTVERHRVLDRSYAHVQLHRTSDAWHELEHWIGAHCRGAAAFKEYPPLLEATARWNDPRIGDRVTNEYLARLLALGETGIALDVVERRLESNPTFSPAAPADATRLAELAGLAGKRALQRRLSTR